MKVTAYCAAEALKLDLIEEFVSHSHGVVTKRFDECTYFSYDGQTKENLYGNPHKLYALPMLRTPFGEEPVYSPANVVLTEDSSPEKQELEPFPEWMSRGEVFVFDYGVLVLWNFTAREESDFLKHIKAYSVGFLDMPGRSMLIRNSNRRFALSVRFSGSIPPICI
jgi:uncharacterized Rmd1/YagE family protein